MGVKSKSIASKRIQAWALVAAVSFVFVPSGQAERISMSIGTACEGLDDVECCAQTAAIYAFRAMGDQLPKRAKLVVNLSCTAAKRRLPKHACRQLLIARGQSPSAATEACEAKGLAKRCVKQEGCKACAKDLAKLGFQDTQGLCFAATWFESTRRGHRR